MAFCSECGTQLAQGAAFCSSCGARAGGTQQQQGFQQPPSQQQYQQQGYQQYQQQYQRPAYPGDDAINNKAMGILAYLGILVLVPIFAAKDSPFARFHANQGLVLAIAEIAYGIIISILNVIFFAISWGLAIIMGIVLSFLWLVFLVAAIIGIVNAAKGEMRPLPIIGGITILK